jgi:hypothetical protein
VGHRINMSFEKIGPYELTRGDLVAASLVISFSTGAKSARWKAALIVLVGMLLAIEGIISSEPLTVSLGIFLIVFLFVVAPALRSRKGNKDIYLDYSPEGIVAETESIRTLYKWATIRLVKKIGSRLFIMINDSCALVISSRSTSVDNIENLTMTVAEHQHTAGL